MKCFALAAMLALAVPAAAQIEPAQVKVTASPNVLGYPVTTRLQNIEVTDRGVRATFDRCQSWPKVTPPGWDGPLIYTLHLFLNIGGEWWESGIIQFWACDQFSGGPIYQENQIARNWVYDARWGNMVGHQPVPGERIGFMVSAGNARGQDDHLVAERSNIVIVAMPSFASNPPFLWEEGFTFVTPPAPPTPPIAPPTTPPTPQPNVDALIAELRATQLAFTTFVSLEQVQHNNEMAAITAMSQNLDAHRAAVRSKYEAVVGSPVFKYLMTAVTTFVVT
ncbi:MAG: hypothetical protein M3Y64_08140, partial [Gemmatimonadota bacterium]|nr:hypothetical protein [Gemmatimonadota bacterium]